jgi:hypothetical protein
MSGSNATDKSHILFTDPASLGSGGYYTSTGDVDDIACIIFMSQKLQKELLVVICDDDENGNRHVSFNIHLGTLLKETYGITVMSEATFSNYKISKETKIYIHAPIKDPTVNVLQVSKDNLTHVFTQGDDGSVNFKNSEEAKAFVAEMPENKVTRFSTTKTNFTISYKLSVKDSLDKKCKKVYTDYFLFQKRKSFGTALHHKSLCNRLYSDTGFEGGLGNGVGKYKDLIDKLKETKQLPELSGKLLTAFNNTISHGGCDETAIKNGKDLISLMNLYCHYDELIVDDKLPNMGNLGEIKKRDVVDKSVAKMFDIVHGFVSTPLFDFASFYYAYENDSATKEELQNAVVKSLNDLNTANKTNSSAGERKEQGGGRKRRKKRRKSKRKSKKRKSKKRKSKRKSRKSRKRRTKRR